jgi:hypothetical protein
MILVMFCGVIVTTFLGALIAQICYKIEQS